ncbi:MAG TPA: EamA family transporter [Gaiellaceae bacterium]|nr:EamA family transporter [Gaiellaceae bacterium]
MPAVLLSLASSLSFGVADFLGGVASRRGAVVTVLLVSHAVGLAGIAVLVAARADGPPDAVFVPLAALSAALGTAGVAALYRGLATGLMSVVAPIAAAAAVIPVVWGAVRGDAPTALQNGGIALALGGVVLVSRTRTRPGADARLAAGAGLGLVAAALFGLFLVSFEAASRDDPYWAVLALRVSSVAMLAAVAAVLRPSLRTGRRGLGVLAVIGLLDVAGNAFFAVATTKGLIGVVAVLSSLYPIVTIGLARLVLRERLHPLQAAGVAAALAGVGLIAAG